MKIEIRCFWSVYNEHSTFCRFKVQVDFFQISQVSKIPVALKEDTIHKPVCESVVFNYMVHLVP